MPDVSRLRWEDAWRQALYGPGGFFLRPEGPAAHFRTSVSASPLFAAALARLARGCGVRGVLDVGAGRGELLAALAAADPGLALHGVDVVARPAGLPPAAAWSSSLPRRAYGVLVVANEWLDDVPCPVVEVRDGRWRYVLVDPSTGEEGLGGVVQGPDREWLDRWWPVGEDGDRAEVGRPRDEAWADLLQRLDRCVAVAVDYGHERAGRAERRWAGGTLVGYRDGRQVAPVPDGRSDLTAHVAMDAVAAAGLRAGARPSLLTSQRRALSALGVTARRPAAETARSDPRAYVRGLSAAGEAAELLDPRGLGGFVWLVQAVGTTFPPLARAPLGGAEAGTT